MMEKIKTALLQGRYEIIDSTFKNMKSNDIRVMLLDIAYDTGSVGVYCFVQHMIRQTGNVFWKELAIELMVNPLCHVEGAYSVALFHSRELLKLERSIENLEMILFFYGLPEKLIDEKEAKSVAMEILKTDQYNKIALEVIGILE